MSNWRTVRLDQLGTVQRGRSRHRPRDDPKLFGGPYPFVQTGDVKAAGLRLFTYNQTYSAEGLTQSRLWPTGTLCITIAANICDTTILGISACFPDSVVGFTPQVEISDVVFVKYMLDLVKQQFTAISRGATQDNLSLEKLLSQDLWVPGIDEQRRIASILGAYDDLIEVNRRRVAVLEAMARGLFEEWFVRFRFPGHENHKIIETPDGPLPEGWERTPFSQLAQFLNGHAFKPADFQPEGLPIVKIPELKNGVTEKTPRNSGLNVPRQRYLEDGDLLFSWSGTLAVGEWTNGPALLNQHLFRVVPRGLVGRSFLRVALLQAMPRFQSQGVGATMQHIRRAALDQTSVPIPTQGPILSLADNALTILYNQVVILRRQNQTLAASRDLLLPRLISGDLSVAAASRDLEAAA